MTDLCTDLVAGHTDGRTDGLTMVVTLEDEVQVVDAREEQP